MSLFQCQECGCVENTALSSQGCDGPFARYFDWSDNPEREGKKLCSACGPARHSDGSPTTLGKWHGKFRRVFLPIGMFKTNDKGNLEHIETGSEDFSGHEIK